MKHIICFVAVAVFTISVSAQRNFTITGKAETLKEGAKITLRKINDQKQMIIIDSQIVPNGTFAFRGVAGEKPEKAFLHIEQENLFEIVLSVWLAADSDIHIEGTGNPCYRWKVKSNIKEQNEFNRYIDATQELRLSTMPHMINKFTLIQQIQRTTGDENIKQLVNKIDSIGLITDSIEAVIIQENIKIMKETPVSEIWLDKLLEQSQSSRRNKTMAHIESLRTLYNSLNDKQKEVLDNAKIKSFLYPPKIIQTGDKMGDGEIKNIQGYTHRLSEFTGKYICINFWSPNCEPCITGMNRLNDLYENNKGKLTVINICTDSEESWKNFSATKDIQQNWYEEDQINNLQYQYDVKSYPHYVIISPQGIVLDSWENHLFEELKNKIEKYIHK